MIQVLRDSHSDRHSNQEQRGVGWKGSLDPLIFLPIVTISIPGIPKCLQLQLTPETTGLCGPLLAGDERKYCPILFVSYIQVISSKVFTTSTLGGWELQTTRTLDTAGGSSCQETDVTLARTSPCSAGSYLFGVRVEGDGHVQQKLPLLHPAHEVLDAHLQVPRRLVDLLGVTFPGLCQLFCRF